LTLSPNTSGDSTSSITFLNPFEKEIGTNEADRTVSFITSREIDTSLETYTYNIRNVSPVSTKYTNFGCSEEITGSTNKTYKLTPTTFGLFDAP
jgi:hypothetical protein